MRAWELTEEDILGDKAAQRLSKRKERPSQWDEDEAVKASRRTEYMKPVRIY